MPTNYERTFDGCALYLPAITFAYAKFVQSDAPIRDLGLTARDLDFMNPASRLFYYPYGLLSAGQVRSLSNQNSLPVMARDLTRTVLLGDSGGFQIQNNRLPFDPATTPIDVLRWLETNATYSMGLDFPTGGLESGNMVAHRARLERDGHKPRIDALCAQNRQSCDFNAALVQTMLNNELMIQHRVPGATMLLNVLQGRTEPESKAWFEAVRDYPLDGWAFAGGNVRNFALLIRRLLEMRDAGLLGGCRWIHILGTSRPELAVLYTHLQRKLRQQCNNPDLQISFDSASPFIVASKHDAFYGFTLNTTGWGPHITKVIRTHEEGMDEFLVRFLRRFHQAGQFDGLSALGRIARIRDVAVRPFDVTKLDDQSRSGWDALSAYIVMNHNVQVMLEMMKFAHRAFDEGLDEVPGSVIDIEIAINHLFEAADPYTNFDHWTARLDHYVNA